MVQKVSLGTLTAYVSQLGTVVTSGDDPILPPAVPWQSVARIKIPRLPRMNLSVSDYAGSLWHHWRALSEANSVASVDARSLAVYVVSDPSRESVKDRATM